MLGQPWLARRRAVRVRELLAEACPGVNVDQHVGEVDLWETRHYLGRELGGPLGTLGAGSRRT
jgi:hypothetical protein